MSRPFDHRSTMTNYWAGVSGKGNGIIPRRRQNKNRKERLSPLSETNIYHLPPSRPPCFSLATTFNNEIFMILFCSYFCEDWSVWLTGSSAIWSQMGRYPFPITLSYKLQYMFRLSLHVFLTMGLKYLSKMNIHLASQLLRCVFVVY